MGMRINKYDLMRKRAGQESQAQTQQESDALQRRFASQGMSGSGAAIKQEQMALDRGAQRNEQARQAIDVAEADEQMRLDEAEKNRQFAKGEREAGQAFQAGETSLARKFAAEQQKAQFDFQSLERQAQEAFQRGENDKARELQGQAMKMQADQFAKNYEMAKRQFDLDAFISYQNLVTARGGNPLVLSDDILERLGLTRDMLGALSPEQGADAEDQLYAGAASGGKKTKNVLSNPVEAFKTGVKSMFG